jgi:hypothetical protein
MYAINFLLCFMDICYWGHPHTRSALSVTHCKNRVSNPRPALLASAVKAASTTRGEILLKNLQWREKFSSHWGDERLIRLMILMYGLTHWTEDVVCAYIQEVSFMLMLAWAQNADNKQQCFPLCRMLNINTPWLQGELVPRQTQRVKIRWI